MLAFCQEKVNNVEFESNSCHSGSASVKRNLSATGSRCQKMNTTTTATNAAAATPTTTTTTMTNYYFYEILKSFALCL